MIQANRNLRASSLGSVRPGEQTPYPVVGPLFFLDDHSGKLPCRVGPSVSKDFDVRPPIAHPLDGRREGFLPITEGL